MMKNNIKSERARLDLSQAALGERLGVSGDVVRNWEDGTTPINKISLLIQMADLFRCSIDYLLGRTDDRILHGYSIDAVQQTNGAA